MKLVVAILVLAAAVVAAKVVIERLAPEEMASASTRLTVDRPGAEAVPGTVASVRLTGDGLRAGFLSDVLSTHVGDRVDAARLEADRAAVRDALIARGHLDATVGEPVVQWSGHRTAWVELPVHAGPQYVIGAVRVEGKLAAKYPVLAEVPTVTPGETVAQARLAGDADLLRTWLGQRGVRARIEPRVDVDRDTHEVTVVFTVK